MLATATFDTLKFVRRLRDAGVDEKQAEAFSEAIRDIHGAQSGELATKGEILEVKHDIKKLEMRMDARFDKELGPLRADLLLIKRMLALIITATVLPALKTLFG
ncbi:MAG: CCDC90 family protein [Magnetococcus sp. YQC-3]